MRRISTLTIVIIACLGFTALAYVILSQPSSPATSQNVVWPPPANSDPHLVFQKVVNDCGVCGTDTPIGGWETYDGRIIIFREDGTYSFLDTGDLSHSGTWEFTGTQMCLTTLGVRKCLGYVQRVDAMKLDGAIYIRE
jgi:hypothetical protein